MENRHKHLKEIELKLETSGDQDFSNNTDNGKINLPENEELIINGQLMNSEGKNLSEKGKQPESNMSYISQKESILNEVLNDIPEADIKELISSIEDDKETGENDKEVSRLNPESEILTKKDPDEVIVLPNKELKKMYNQKSKNQPL